MNLNIRRQKVDSLDGNNAAHTLGMNSQEMPLFFSKPINMTTHLSVLTISVFFSPTFFSEFAECASVFVRLCVWV